MPSVVELIISTLGQILINVISLKCFFFKSGNEIIKGKLIDSTKMVIQIETPLAGQPSNDLSIAVGATATVCVIDLFLRDEQIS